MKKFLFLIATGLLTWGLTAQTVDSKKIFGYEQSPDGQILNIGGKKFGPYKNVGNVLFSADLKHWVFWAANETPKITVVYDGKNTDLTFPLPGNFELSLNCDGSIWSLVAHLSDNSSVVVVNGKQYERFAGNPGDFPSIQYSADGGKWGYRSGQEGQATVNVNDKTYGPYQNIPQFILGTASSPWYAVVVKNGVSVVLVDGKELASCPWAPLLIVSADGQHYAFEYDKKSGRNALHLVVVDGKEYDGDSLRKVVDKGGTYICWNSYPNEDSAFLNLMKF